MKWEEKMWQMLKEKEKRGKKKKREKMENKRAQEIQNREELRQKGHARS
jgi:hypothetical protein